MDFRVGKGRVNTQYEGCTISRNIILHIDKRKRRRMRRRNTACTAVKRQELYSGERATIRGLQTPEAPIGIDLDPKVH
jgi:hypothetical protein